MTGNNIGSTGNYSGYERLILLAKELGKRLPKSVNFRIEKQKYLTFRITMPDGRRVPRPSGCPLTDEGMYEALKKSESIDRQLQICTSETEFWNWYDREILGKKPDRMENDATTYRAIFSKIESRFWEHRNKNTGRKRDKSIPNDVSSYNTYYGNVFARFPDWDKQPKWQEIKDVLHQWEPGTKSFKDAYFVLKKVVDYCPDNIRMVAELSSIDPQQHEFRELQSISLEAYLSWHSDVLQKTTIGQVDEARQWLWVASMCVLYGLRPTEVAAIRNITAPYVDKGVVIKSLCDKSSDMPLIVLGASTYYGVTIKTGARVCRPMSNNPELWDELRILEVGLPEWTPNLAGKPEEIRNGFARKLGKFMQRYKCPVTQAYAFRHLANQIGEREGIPQEIRARSLGHSVAINDSVYKARENINTTVDLLLNHKTTQASREVAEKRLVNIGYSLDDPKVKAILDCVYG